MVLVLNADYRPLSIIPWERAVRLQYKYKYTNDNSKGIEVIEYYQDDSIKGVSHNYPLPAVIRVRSYIKPRRDKLNFSRKNVYLRDNCTCQYCGNQFSPDKLTYDHVTPRSRGGKTTWTNIVTACLPCNHRKANKTPEQAKMRLLKLPAEPNCRGVMHIAPWQKIPQEWRTYINA